MFENVGQFEDERDALEQFILHTKQFLLHIAFEHYFEKFTYSDGDAILFEPLHRAQYQRALSEYMGSGELERLIRQVHGLTQAQLAHHGLTGAQLGIKREIVRLSEQRFAAQPSGRLFRRLLKAVDLLLDSILAAAGGSTALRELKEAAGLLPVIP